MRTNAEMTSYISIGLEPWDQNMMGIKKGSLFLLGSRPSHGKTAFAVTVACKSAFNGPHNTLFCSLELAKERIYQRLYAIANNTPYKQCPTSKNAWDDGFRPKATLAINDKPRQSTTDIETTATQLDRELKDKGQQLDMLIVDYLELMDRTDSTLTLKAAFQQTLQQLKVLAQKLNIAVLVMSQISRAATPYGMQEDLPELDGFRNMDDETFELVDGLGMLARPFRSQEAVLIIKKSPSGFEGKIPLYFNQDMFCFSAENVQNGGCHEKD